MEGGREVSDLLCAASASARSVWVRSFSCSTAAFAAAWSVGGNIQIKATPDNSARPCDGAVDAPTARAALPASVLSSFAAASLTWDSTSFLRAVTSFICSRHSAQEDA
jgi:hypothetical protein